MLSSDFLSAPSPCEWGRLSVVVVGLNASDCDNKEVKEEAD